MHVEKQRLACRAVVWYVPVDCRDVNKTPSVPPLLSPPDPVLAELGRIAYEKFKTTSKRNTSPLALMDTGIYNLIYKIALISVNIKNMLPCYFPLSVDHSDIYN